MNKKSFLALLLISSSLLVTSCSNKKSYSSQTHTSHTSHIDSSIEDESILESSSSFESSSETTSTLNEYIKRIQVATDDVGIYSVVFYLSNKASDKGELEFIYKGAKGTPQEDSVVANFRLLYWNECTGIEMQTFYNNEVYQNFHKQEEVKFVMEFGAFIRAGDVTIYYTPDGGTKEEIFYTSEACAYHQ